MAKPLGDMVTSDPKVLPKKAAESPIAKLAASATVGRGLQVPLASSDLTSAVASPDRQLPSSKVPQPGSSRSPDVNDAVHRLSPDKRRQLALDKEGRERRLSNSQPDPLARQNRQHLVGLT